MLFRTILKDTLPEPCQMRCKYSWGCESNLPLAPEEATLSLQYQRYFRMRRRNNKIRQKTYPFGTKINVAQFGTTHKNSYVTGDNKNTICLWSFEEDDPVQTLQTLQTNSSQTQQTEVSAVTLTNDEHQVISGSNRGIINVWDIDTAKVSCTLKGHSTSVNSFSTFHNDEFRLASGSYDTHIKLWDLRTRNNTVTLKGHNKQVNTMTISPNDLMLLSGSEDNTVKLWDLRYPEKLMHTYMEHTAPVFCVRFNPEDMMFASGSADKTAKYFQSEVNEHQYISSTDPTTSAITALEFSDDGSLLYTASNDSLKVWKMGKNGMLVETVESPWKGVQDLCMTDYGLVGLAFYNNNFSFWAYDGGSRETKDTKDKEKEEKERQKERQRLPLIKGNKSEQLKDVRENINFALNLVNNLEKKENTRFRRNNSGIAEENPSSERQEDKKKNFLEQLERKKEDENRRREEENRRKEEENRKKEEDRRQYDEQRKAKQQQERVRKQNDQKQRKERQEFEQKQKKRIELERHQASIAQFNEMMAKKQQNREQVNKLLQSVLIEDNLDASLNSSAFMIDNSQKEKFQQYELINDTMKDSVKFNTIIVGRTRCSSPIIKWWASNEIKSALFALNEADISIVVDVLNAIFSSEKLKSHVKPDVAVALCRKAAEVLQDKHARYVKTSLWVLNQLVCMHKDQLVRIKNFVPNREVDFSREERLAKYDRLIESFLGVFKMERLKKYTKEREGQPSEVTQIAATLYRNLEEILRKWNPKEEPQTA